MTVILLLPVKALDLGHSDLPSVSSLSRDHRESREKTEEPTRRLPARSRLLPRGWHAPPTRSKLRDYGSRCCFQFGRRGERTDATSSTGSVVARQRDQPLPWRPMTAAVNPSPFRCDVRAERDRVIASLAGELDLTEASTVARTLTELLDTGVKRIVIDLRLVSFIDSTGLQTLLGLRAQAHERDAALALIRGPLHVQRIFEITDTTSLFAFEEPQSLR
jgi:anti-sigma B factor antagonist